MPVLTPSGGSAEGIVFIFEHSLQSLGAFYGMDPGLGP